MGGTGHVPWKSSPRQVVIMDGKRPGDQRVEELGREGKLLADDLIMGD